MGDENGPSSGTLSSFSSTETSPSSQNSSVIISPPENDTEVTLKVAVYTPPFAYTNSSANDTLRTIKIFVEDVDNPSIKIESSLSLYHVPVVMVHGIWSTPNASWINSTFQSNMERAGYDVYLANYSEHNAETFDPFYSRGIGNHGINSIRNIVDEALSAYHEKDIAASQVDIVGHSMGGLMARGFVQQPDYESQTNYMQGYIHRLITIGTPHYGAHLAGVLYNHTNEQYCVEPKNKTIWHETKCTSSLLGPYPLKTIFKLGGLSIEEGGVEALVPGSMAYKHMCQTNISSYAIAASWAPEADKSHKFIEYNYKNITGNPNFDLDIDGFDGTIHGNNDLQVNITSQLGGLVGQMRTTNSMLPDRGEVYNNTIHYPLLLKNEQDVKSEIGAPYIQKDVILLLQSPQDKFANAIGVGSPCQIP